MASEDGRMMTTADMAKRTGSTGRAGDRTCQQ